MGWTAGSSRAVRGGAADAVADWPARASVGGRGVVVDCAARQDDCRPSEARRRGPHRRGRGCALVAVAPTDAGRLDPEPSANLARRASALRREPGRRGAREFRCNRFGVPVGRSPRDPHAGQRAHHAARRVRRTRRLRLVRLCRFRRLRAGSSPAPRTASGRHTSTTGAASCLR